MICWQRWNASHTCRHALSTQPCRICQHCTWDWRSKISEHTDLWHDRDTPTNKTSHFQLLSPQAYYYLAAPLVSPVRKPFMGKKRPRHREYTGRSDLIQRGHRQGAIGQLMESEQSPPIFIFVVTDRSRSLLYSILQGIDWQRTRFFKSLQAKDRKELWIILPLV